MGASRSTHGLAAALFLIRAVNFLTALKAGVVGGIAPKQRSSGEVLPGRARPARAEEV
jgi:hypothetical protein